MGSNEMDSLLKTVKWKSMASFFIIVFSLIRRSKPGFVQTLMLAFKKYFCEPQVEADISANRLSLQKQNKSIWETAWTLGHPQFGTLCCVWQHKPAWKSSRRVCGDHSHDIEKPLHNKVMKNLQEAGNYEKTMKTNTLILSKRQRKKLKVQIWRKRSNWNRLHARWCMCTLIKSTIKRRVKMQGFNTSGATDPLVTFSHSCPRRWP